MEELALARLLILEDRKYMATLEFLSTLTPPKDFRDGSARIAALKRVLGTIAPELEEADKKEIETMKQQLMGEIGKVYKLKILDENPPAVNIAASSSDPTQLFKVIKREQHA